VPFTYAGTATVHGIKTYKFVENVGPRQIATQAIPGSLVGKGAATVTLPQYYQINLVYYVDPDTGALLNVDEHQNMSLRDPSTNTQALLLFDAHLIATPASVNAIVALDNNGRNELVLLETILPLAIGILGFIALIAGILLSRRRRPMMDDELDAMSRKLAASAADSAVRPASPRHAAPSPQAAASAQAAAREQAAVNEQATTPIPKHAEASEPDNEATTG
jgi:Porin PorA